MIILSNAGLEGRDNETFSDALRAIKEHQRRGDDEQVRNWGQVRGEVLSRWNSLRRSP